MAKIELLCFFVATLLFNFSQQKSFKSDDGIYNIEDAEIHFQDFVKVYAKKYVNEAEYYARFEIFKESLREINKLNRAGGEKSYDITPFADLTWDEFSSRYNGYKHDDDLKTESFDAVFPHLKNLSAPGSFDWRTQGNILNPIKNQGNCGSCWAFSAIAAMESHYAVTKGQLPNLSEQQLVDCVPNTDCIAGGHSDDGFGYLQSAGGSESETDYPYVASRGDCKTDSSRAVVRVTEHHATNSPTPEQLQQLIMKYGAVSTVMHSYEPFKHFAGSSVIRPTDEDCSPAAAPNHAVNLIGYGEEGGVKYWLLRNSWGGNWGDGGYFKMEEGKCLIGSVVFTAEVA